MTGQSSLCRTVSYYTSDYTACVTQLYESINVSALRHFNILYNIWQEGLIRVSNAYLLFIVVLSRCDKKIKVLNRWASHWSTLPTSKWDYSHWMGRLARHFTWKWLFRAERYKEYRKVIEGLTRWVPPITVTMSLSWTLTRLGWNLPILAG